MRPIALGEGSDPIGLHGAAIAGPLPGRFLPLQRRADRPRGCLEVAGSAPGN